MQIGDRFLSSKTAFKIFVFLVLLNLLFLDFILVNGQKTQIIEKTVSIPAVSTCPASCLSVVSVAPTGKLNPSIIPTSTPLPAFLVKEFFVPLGSGSSSSNDWQDIPGLRASLNSTNYGNIKTVTFEATVRIPTGNQTAYVRLYNVTDKHPVWFSDVSLDGGLGQLLVSKPITLDSGNKTYQVQMKTSLQYPAFLDQSRIHIITM